MGDSSDASSSAALSAQSLRPDHKASGFFRRIYEALSPTEAGRESPERTDVAPQSQFRGMINLRRMRIEDVAIPKVEITAVPETITKSDLVKVFNESGYSRLPVYEGTLDSPLGFVHLKDFALRYGFNGASGKVDLREMLRPLLFVPPSMPIGVLLAKMQAERRHLALVIDEYGGVDGLVTIEDLIEQVIGEIEDEHDAEEDALWIEEKEGCYVAQARAPLDEFEDAVGRSLGAHKDVDAEDIGTLGGLVFMLAGHVPSRGEVVTHPDGMEFEVLDADPRRIKRLRVIFPHAQEG